MRYVIGCCMILLCIYGICEFGRGLGVSIREREEMDSLKKEKLKLEIKRLKPNQQ